MVLVEKHFDKRFLDVYFINMMSPGNRKIWLSQKNKVYLNIPNMDVKKTKKMKESCARCLYKDLLVTDHPCNKCLTTKYEEDETEINKE